LQAEPFLEAVLTSSVLPAITETSFCPAASFPVDLFFVEAFPLKLDDGILLNDQFFNQSTFT